MYRVDEGLPRRFNMLFGNITRITFILAIISAGVPIFAVLIIPLALIYLFMQRYYLRISISEYVIQDQDGRFNS